jgi:hypothetical protein
MVPIENNPVIKKILQDFVSQSAKAFRDAVRREGLLDTEDLLNSLREGAVEVGSGFITGHVYYSELLRVKDLKELRYITLNTRTKKLRKTLSEIEKAGGKGSDNWKKYQTELKGVERTLMQEAVKNSEAEGKKNGSASDRTSFAGHVKRARDGPSRHCGQTCWWMKSDCSARKI